VPGFRERLDSCGARSPYGRIQRSDLMDIGAAIYRRRRHYATHSVDKPDVVGIRFAGSSEFFYELNIEPALSRLLLLLGFVAFNAALFDRLSHLSPPTIPIAIKTAVRERHAAGSATRASVFSVNSTSSRAGFIVFEHRDGVPVPWGTIVFRGAGGGPGGGGRAPGSARRDAGVHMSSGVGYVYVWKRGALEWDEPEGFAVVIGHRTKEVSGQSPNTCSPIQDLVDWAVNSSRCQLAVARCPFGGPRAAPSSSWRRRRAATTSPAFGMERQAFCHDSGRG